MHVRWWRWWMWCQVMEVMDVRSVSLFSGSSNQRKWSVKTKQRASVSFFFSRKSVAFHILMMTLFTKCFQAITRSSAVCLQFTPCPLSVLHCCITDISWNNLLTDDLVKIFNVEQIHFYSRTFLFHGSEHWSLTSTSSHPNNVHYFKRFCKDFLFFPTNKVFFCVWACAFHSMQYVSSNFVL